MSDRSTDTDTGTDYTPTYVMIEIEDSGGPMLDLTPDVGHCITYQFTWRGLVTLLFKKRILTIRLYMLVPEVVYDDI